MGKIRPHDSIFLPPLQNYDSFGTTTILSHVAYTSSCSGRGRETIIKYHCKTLRATGVAAVFLRVFEPSVLQVLRLCFYVFLNPPCYRCCGCVSTCFKTLRATGVAAVFLRVFVLPRPGVHLVHDDLSLWGSIAAFPSQYTRSAQSAGIWRDKAPIAGERGDILDHQPFFDQHGKTLQCAGEDELRFTMALLSCSILS